MVLLLAAEGYDARNGARPGDRSDLLLALLHRFVLEVAGFREKDFAFIFPPAGCEDSTEIDVGPPNLVVGARFIVAGEHDGFPQHLFGALHVVLGVGIQTQIQERLGRGRIDFGRRLEVLV